MAWIITKDLICDGVDVGTGIGTLSNDTVRFRLLDGDGEVYYEGYIDCTDLHGYEEHAFSPLNDFGVGSGCTELQYWIKDWHTL